MAIDFEPDGSSGPVSDINLGATKPSGLDFLLKAAGYATTRNLDSAPWYDPLAQTARLGQFANKGNQELAGNIAEKSGERAAIQNVRDGTGAELNIPKFLGGGSVNSNALPGVLAGTALGTASEFLLPQNRLGVAAYAAGPAMAGYKAIRGAPSSKPGFIAQLGQARTKVPAGDIQQAINDPSVWDAPSVQAANEAYGQASPGKGVAKSLGEKLDKTVLGEGDYTEAINRTGRMLKGTEIDEAGNKVPLDPQSALEGVQSINRFLRNKMYTAKLDPAQMAEIQQLKTGLMDWMENNGSAGLRDAASVVRKAHVNENMRRMLPQNKFGGYDALRTMGAGSELAAALGLTIAGHPGAAAPIAAEAFSASPAVWGGAIRNWQSATNSKVIGAAGAAFNGYSNLGFDQEAGPQRGR